MANTAEYNNKVVLSTGEVLIDLTGDTIDAAHALAGYKFHDKTGATVTGSCTYDADTSDDTYWLVYAPDFDKGGYVNKDYLVDRNPVIRKTVKVTSGYLALRSEMAYDDANEIGRLNTGDIVQIADSSDSTYWKVYSERLGKYGYVDKNYLQ